ncbi:hypothetical protein [Burkholderia sp. Ac-20379]|uniref:hypothetical protein n=1 Tax=Burkholderia sp. Ac-20379 TaxID=2703900 RepID=UPI0019813618|nr:hypothetical protein [Burkholderia sp. Ac-20379]MBN3724072.1 DUF1488 domain-containing protein [Burkholderia sp. Ac-20379]
MTSPAVHLTTPIVSGGSTLWFSAYASGWGYAAFSLTADTLCQCFGAAGSSPQQLRLAFELGRQRLARAIGRYDTAPAGGRTALTPADL